VVITVLTLLVALVVALPVAVATLGLVALAVTLVTVVVMAVTVVLKGAVEGVTRGPPGAPTAGDPAALGPADFDDPPASLTSAAVKPPSESKATATTTISRARQRGTGASAVRAAAPQRTHQSWSSRSGAPHNGHCSSAWGPSPGGVDEPPALLLTRPSSLPADRAV
jgi:hypothetical protein